MSWNGPSSAKPCVRAEGDSRDGAHHCDVKRISWTDGDAEKINGVSIL